jgi:hypothetical protein
MENPPTRNFTRLAIAIVVATVVIAAATFAAGREDASQTASISPNHGGTPTSPTDPRLYQVTFRQTGACSPTLFAWPWSVTLGGEGTTAQPWNATLPVQSTASHLNPNDAIAFSVPDGTYRIRSARASISNLPRVTSTSSAQTSL